jgi:3-dehydroquinate dehydratase type I
LNDSHVTPMICVPITARNTGEAIEKIARANPVADVLEFRLDLMESFCLEEMIHFSRKPVMVTYRSLAQGGKGSADFRTRSDYLMRAIDAGADMVDVECTMPLRFRQEFFQPQRTFKVILSSHFVNGTPDRNILEQTLADLASAGADIVKIVTKAEAPEDNLRVLNLLPKARKLNIRLIAFCMGSMGRLSRIASSLLGGYLTFASLGQAEESADGQIPVREMRKMLGILKE